MQQASNISYQVAIWRRARPLLLQAMLLGQPVVLGMYTLMSRECSGRGRTKRPIYPEGFLCVSLQETRLTILVRVPMALILTPSLLTRQKGFHLTRGLDTSSTL